MSLFNKIKKFSREEDVNATNIEKEFLNIYTLLNQFFTEPKNWTPTITASGAMTIADEDIEWARYSIIGRRVFFDVRLSFTLGGVASGSVYFTAPPGLKPVYTVNVGDGNRVGDAVSRDGTWIWNTSLELFDVRRDDNVNWALGTNKSIQIIGSYEISK